MKIQKIFKLLFVPCMLALGVLSNTIHASASENTPAEENIELTSVVNSIDLNEADTYNEQDVLSPDGELLGKIIIEKEPEIPPKIQPLGIIGNQNAGNGNYAIKFIGVSANVGYTVTVKNKNITRAYNTWHNSLVWGIDTGNLTFSSKQATLRGVAKVAIKDFGFHTTFRLRAVISGNTLQTHLDFN